MTPGPAPQPPFGYGVVLCKDFDDLLAGGLERPRPLGSLVDLAATHGALLLQARGGAGKSTAMLAAAAAARQGGMLVVEVDAKDIGLALEDGVADEGAVLDALARAAQPERTSQFFLDSADAVLLLVDGVNEVPPEQAHAILAAVQHLAQRSPSLRVVVSDRLHRRSLPARSWTLATLSGIPRDEVSKLMGGGLPDHIMETLSLPFYLDTALGRGLTSRGAMHDENLRVHASQSKEDIARLAAATFAEYRATRSRRIGDSFAQALKLGQLERLKAAGILTSVGPLRFAHHLVSDYLAARFLSGQPSWTRDDLDILTLGASSFDALGMLLELAPDRSDELVMVTYDWNFYASAFLLAEAPQAGVKVSSGLETAILGMLAERRFDRISATALQVTDALRSHESRFTEELLAASDRVEVGRIVSSWNTDQEWGQWRSLLLRDEGSMADADDVALLTIDHPLIGWTTANMLRRLEGSREVLQDIVGLLNSDDGTVRWRAAHALGRHPDPTTVHALFQVLEADDYKWARYGALRSLVEIAADAQPELRSIVLNRLADLAPLLVTRPELSREIARVLELRDPPEAWADATAVVVQKLWAQAEDVDEQDRWSALGQRLRNAA